METACVNCGERLAGRQRKFCSRICKNTYNNLNYQSYISQHSYNTQSVKITDSTSDPHSLSYGVPQGSVLGPVLFTMYTKALSSVISGFSKIQHYLYADDTQIYIAITSGNASHNIPILQQCLDAVHDWMACNKLKLNLL